MKDIKFKDKIAQGINDLFYIWKREFQTTFRDQGVLIFFILVPLGYPLLYSFIYDNEVVREVPAVVVDDSHSSLSREYLRKVDATPDIQIVAYCADMEEAKQMLKNRLAYGIIYIPSDFSDNIAKGKQTQVSIYCDMSGLLYYKSMLIANTAVSLDMNKDIKIARSGNTTERQDEITGYPIEYEEISIFNPTPGFVPVVKHGNYGATSVSGASNVMEQHGVKFTSDVDQLRRSMEKCNLAYLHAPLFNPALKAVAPVRKGLAVRTFFNMLGPLVNPVLPAYQLLGVYNLPLLRLYTYTYQESKTKFAVVHSLDGYDEISLTNEFKVATSDHEKIYTPESLGFSRYKDIDLDGGQTPEDAAKIFDHIMNNTATEAQKNVVIVNSAFAIHVIRPEKTIEECIALAKESLESGRALATLKKFIELNS